MKKQLLLILIAGLTLSSQLLNAQAPWVEFNDLQTTYYTNVDNFVTCEVYSNGVIDEICGIGYEIYKDDVLIENVSDFGTAYFKVRQEGDVYYTGQITEGSGMIQIEVGEDLIGAFTLGIFDNYCTNRNRPIEFHATTFVPGEYKVVYYIYSCTNSGTSTGTDFTASMCDGLVHQDLVAETCEGPVVLSSDEFIMNVLEGPTPEFNYSTIEATYPILTDINVTATLNSNGIIDQLCGIGYEVYKDGVLVENIADYGTLNYSVRQEGDTYYTGEIITGSGMIEVTLGEDQISAFTLGIFDTYCVNRNRPVDFTANFVQPGVYKLVSNLYGCTNEGVTTGTSFIASGCDGLEHEDMVAAVCDNPILINQMEVEMEVLAPIVEFTGLQAEYSILNDVNITANINSNGLIDQLCGIGYEIYKDGVLVEDIADYGTLLYSIRQEGDTYFNGEITSGSGMIEVTVGEDEIGAFTLGIFDNYCVNRNRPVDFTANFTTPGLYEMVSTLYSCSNVGTATGTSFEAVNCDGLSHDDYIGETCETPTAVSQETIEINVLAPEILFTGLLPEYAVNSDLNVTANVYSNGVIDQLCGVGYEIYKDGVLIENVADYGTLTYSVRQEGETYYEGEITTGSGMIEVTVGEDQVGAFTLGIFDNYCVNRNRPIDFTANFSESGVYEMVSTIYSCSNTGTPTGTNFIATNCDGLSHDDYIGETCETPTAVSQETIEINVLAPEILFTGLLPEYAVNSDLNVTANVYSNGVIDQLCGVGYEIYKDGVLIENVADYGTLTYSVRQEGETYYEGEITTGSGMIEVTVGEDQVGAFTLGIFDNYCVNRNRPIDFTANFSESGVYEMVSTIYSCSNTGTPTGTNFIATNCDGLSHDDYIGETCETPTAVSQETIEINVLAPEILFTGLLPEYAVNSDLNVTANVYSNGVIDQLCGVGYEIYKDGVLIENVADYGTLTYSVRQEGETYYEGEITTGSGMIEVTVGEDQVGAFTLGIFDNYCVNRNRPIDFTANFSESGVYEMVSTIYSCSNTGTPTGTNFIATNCDGLSHDDYIGETCETPTAVSQETIEINVLAPEILFTGLLPEYAVNSDLNVTANVYSNGVIDQLCGVGYEIYKDGVLIENVADYGTLTYSVRQEGETYYEGEITTGSGMIEVTVGEDQVGAFTLGIFDNYCVNRNRPIDFTANFSESGVYEMVSTIYSCSNTGTPTGTNFIATNCDGLSHDDYIGETCETPVAIYDESVTINILSEIVINQQPISQTICSYETATITIDAEVTITETLSYQWLLDGVVIDGETSNTLETNIAGSYTCLLTAGDVEFLSEAAIVVVSEILLVMESEISICGDESVELDPGVYTSYLWQDNSIEQIFTVTETGTYTVIVTNEIGCTATASVEVTYHEIPEIDLGADGVFCSSEDITIAAPNASSWLWSTTETTQSITVLETGEYSCTITDEFGCQNSDAVEIDVLASPIVDLGEDLIVDEDQILIFGTQLGHSEYLWSTGDTTDFITLNASDLNLGTNVISVTVTGTNGCEGFDEVVITVIPGAAVDTELVNRFAVYPNPTSGILNIAGENIESSEIYNYLGQSILTTKENKIDLSSYPAGVYFVKILTSDKTITVKFIKE